MSLLAAMAATLKQAHCNDVAAAAINNDMMFLADSWLSLLALVTMMGEEAMMAAAMMLISNAARTATAAGSTADQRPDDVKDSTAMVMQ
jgi:hypothetical protein